MTPTLARLGVETWGERVRRAHDRSGLTYREAAKLVGLLVPTSFSSLMRLEKRAEPPTSAAERYRGYLTLLAYGFDPEDFGLSQADLPAGLTLDGVCQILTRPDQPNRMTRALLDSASNVRRLPQRPAGLPASMQIAI